MRDKLLDYLVGGLESQEYDQVRKAIEEDPLLEQELQLLQQSLQPLESCRHYEPPADLRQRTLDHVMAASQQQDKSFLHGLRGDWRVPSRDPAVQLAGLPDTRSKWTILDVIVAGSILVTASLLFFPLVMNSRYAAQLRGCQDNLQQIGIALHEYSDLHDGHFPQQTANEKWSVAGAYAPTLYNNQFVKNSRLFLCPSGTDQQKWAGWRPPTSRDIGNASDERLVSLQEQMGGTYGYNLGYWSEGRYFPPRNLRRSFYPIMADVPSPVLVGRRSNNHGGNGQNILFEDGHVQYTSDSQISSRQDAIFFSDRGRVEPGRHRNDAVIGESGRRLGDR